ncbi:MAG: transposase [Akkermansia sp.]|nr:transposase [Akkermansia sp.]
MGGVAPSRKRQCELLELSRISTNYKKRPLKDEPDTERAIEQLYEEDATIGRRRLPIMLQRRYGIEIGVKKCQRLKKKLGLRTLYPHRDTSAPNPRDEKESYLLKDMEINEVDQV